LVFGSYERRLRRLRQEQLVHETFSRQLIAMQESERQRIAGELHDGMSQDLLVIANEAQFGLRTEGTPSQVAARLTEIASTAKHALQQARQIAHNLRPGLLDELGLTKAVRSCLERAAESSGIAIGADLAEVDGLLPPEYEANLFRIVQESLNNVLKHSRASAAKVTLAKKPAGLCLIIEDDGDGFDSGLIESAASARQGMGLRQIAERAKMMGGRADFNSQPGQGTRVTVEVPLGKLDPSCARDRKQ
jgi:signal transduction histidine kinase